MRNAGIACLLALQLALAPLWAQLPASPPPSAEKLKIVILAGEGTINNIQDRSQRELDLQVSDENHNPVAGVTVSLILPSQGAGGTFSNGSASTTAATDNQGRAVVRGFRPNGVAGKFEIAVAASYHGQTGHAVITQFNMHVEKARRKSHSSKIIAILAVAGAAAAGGAYAASHKSASQPAASPATVPSIIITPGTGTVGAPH